MITFSFYQQLTTSNKNFTFLESPNNIFMVSIYFYSILMNSYIPRIIKWLILLEVYALKNIFQLA